MGALSVPRTAPPGTELWGSPHHTTGRGQGSETCHPQPSGDPAGPDAATGKSHPKDQTDSQRLLLGGKKEKEDQQGSRATD